MAELTNAEARTLSGAGSTTPPGLELRSRSDGDLSRNSYRPSAYQRLAARAVVNDNGTPITGETDRLLHLILDELQSISRRLKEKG